MYLCEICGEVVTQDEIVTGEAVQGEQSYVHAACIDAFHYDRYEERESREMVSYEYSY